MERYIDTIPKDKVEIERSFTNIMGESITIQAYNHGYSILFGNDHFTEFNDKEDTAENNFKKAKAYATKLFNEAI